MTKLSCFDGFCPTLPATALLTALPENGPRSECIVATRSCIAGSIDRCAKGLPMETLHPVWEGEWLAELALQLA